MKSEAARTASQVKKELKKNFPNVKFSVKSDISTGGDSVRVSWEDGPTSKSVKRIIDKYQKGKFDPMYDIYNYDNVNPDLPQVKYVQSDRSYSEHVKREADNKIRSQYSLDGEGYYQRFIRKQLANSSF